MKTFAVRGGRLSLAALVAFGLAWCAPAEIPTEGLSYYSTFDDSSKGIAAELPETGAGAWNTTVGGDPAFITVSGSRKALDLATYRNWSNDSGQTVLAAEDEAFTIAFRARVGGTAKGLLFAIGNNTDGGLSFRRGTAPGSLSVCTGMNVERIAYVPENGSDTDLLCYVLVKDASGLRLHVDGTAIGEGPTEPSGAMIGTSFQWGKRYGGELDGETAGKGAIDALGVWKRALTAEEVAAVSEEMAFRPTVEPFDFALPEAWGEVFSPEPASAYPVALSQAFAFGSESVYRQTVGGKPVLAVNLTGAGVAGTTVGGESSTGADSSLTQDAWINVSGGTYGVLAGGSLSGWASGAANGKHDVVGNAYLRVASGATVEWLVGAGLEGNGGPTQTGEVGIVLEAGAKVGSVVGAWTTKHGAAVTLTGGTRLSVRDPLEASVEQKQLYYAAEDPKDTIIAGSAAIDTNSGSRESVGTVGGRASTEVVTSAAGTFGKTLVGGSYATVTNPGTKASTVGAVEMTLDAPNVTFAKPIYLAGYAKRANNKVRVAGNATLTLKGGAFTGEIALGGGAGEVTVGGKAELVVDGGEAAIDLSQATLSGAFTALTLKGGLNLGANRLPGAALTVEGPLTLTLAATEAEVAERRVILGRAEAVPEGLTVEATGLPEGETWTIEAVAGELRYVPAKTSHTWQPPAGGAAWADGLPGFRLGDDVTFGANAAQETVTLPAEGARVGTLAVAGDYAFEGVGLAADRATVAEGASLTVGAAKVAYLRLTPSEAKGTSGGNNYPGIAELILTHCGEPVAWPAGTTIRQANADGSFTEADWARNEPTPNALVDGVYGGSSGAPSYRNPEDGSTGAYTAPAGNLVVRNNKWWPTDQAGASAVIALGAPLAFDGYVVWSTDHAPRSPRAWTLEVSMDGNTWFPADRRAFAEAEIPAANAAYNGGKPFGFALPSLSFAEGMEVAGTFGGAGTVSGDVAFAEGSVLKAPAEGTLTVDGAVSGAATLDVSAWGGVTDATVRPVLRAPEGLTLAPPEGYAVHYADGCYWLARALTAPLSATVSGAVGWTEAGWQDADGVAVAPAQWDLLPLAEQTATATADAEGATLTLASARSVNAFTVAASEHTLTLAGAKLTPNALTVEGTLSAASATLALPAGTAVAGTLTYDVPSGSVAMPAMTGEGTFVKTGAGTLTLASGTAVAPTVIVRGGALALPSGSDWGTVYATLPNIVAEAGAIVDLTAATGSIADSKATITLRNGGVFRFVNGNSWSSRPIACAFRVENDGETFASFRGSYYGTAAKFTGGISGHGLAVFEQGQSNPYTITGVLSDDGEGALRVRFADANSTITVSGTNTYTGGTEIASAVTARNAEAFGSGPLAIASGKTLTVASGTTLNVRGALSGAGTVSGALCLAEGASLDAAAGMLTVGSVTVAEGATIPVALPADVASGTRLLAWTEGPAATAFVAEGLKPTARLAARADGLYYEEVAFGAVGSDAAAIDALSLEAQRILAETAFAADAVTVAAVSGTTAGRPLTAAEIDGALVCFEGALTAVTEDGSATLTVAYDFGIAAMSYDPAADVLSVTARVQGPEGAAGVTFAPGVTLEVYVPLTEGEGEQLLLSVAVEEASLSEKTVDVAPSAQGSRFSVRPAPIKVRVRK